MSYKIEHEVVRIILHEDNSITFYNKELDTKVGFISLSGEFHPNIPHLDQNSH